MTNKKPLSEPLFHIVKKDALPKWKTTLYTLIAIVISLFVSAIVCGAISKNNPFLFFKYLFEGAFKTPRKRWTFFRDAALLLGVAMALVPAFKMKFWNLGGNGQILMGALATIYCMKKLGGNTPDWVANICMILSSVVIGAIWAVIPAIFKAFFKTNESLFTLMMNYIAVGFVNYYITKNADTGSNTIRPIKVANLPKVYNEYMLTIIVFSVVAIFMIVYFKFSKHGYEVSVVGESENTARYVGIKVKKVIIRTLALSGAICGLVGLMLAGSINRTITTSSANNMGFTAIMVAWLAKLDPITVIFSTLFITFVNNGMSTVRTSFKLTSVAATNIVLGIIYFFIIGCEFFLTYRIVFRKRGKNNDKKVSKKKGEEA